MAKDVVIFGSGSHAKVVYEIIKLNSEFNFIGFVDKNIDKESFLGYPVISCFHSINKFSNQESLNGIIAIGDNAKRYILKNKIMEEIPKFNFINAIHPSAIISSDVLLGHGNVFMARSVVNCGTKISDHCIINTNSSVDHDCILGKFSSLAPGVTLGGNVSVGAYSSIGIGSNAIHGVRVGRNCIIGGGSFVNKDVEDNSLCFGVPCKFIRKHEFGSNYL